MMHPRVDRPRDTSEATAGVTWESRGIFRIVVVFAATHRCRCRRPRFSSTRTRLQSPSLAAALNPNSEILVYTTFAMFVRRERVTVKRVPYTIRLRTFAKVADLALSASTSSIDEKQFWDFPEKWEETIP